MSPTSAVWRTERTASRNLGTSYFLVRDLYQACCISPRQIPVILSRAVTDSDTGFIHKSKANTNGTFSIGKTWNLSELRGIEVNVRSQAAALGCGPLSIR